MAETTGIAWTRSSWSPWIGCTEVSPGCEHCYARELDKRHRYGGGVHWGAGVPRYRTKSWDMPIGWNKKAAKSGARWTVFPSLCDPFDNEVPEEWRIDLWELIEATPALTWLLLTKRIGNAAKMMPVNPTERGPMQNVWLGASVVNQEEADRDIPKLLATPAAKRFVSYEPALGPVDFRRWLDKAPKVAESLAGSGPLDYQERQHRLNQRDAIPDAKDRPHAHRFPAVPPDAGVIPSYSSTTELSAQPVDDRAVGVVDGQANAGRNPGAAPPIDIPLSVEHPGDVGQHLAVRGDRDRLRIDARADATHFDAPCEQPSPQGRSGNAGDSGQGIESFASSIPSDQCGLVHNPHCTSRIDWIICGGESSQGGAKARPFDLAWARSTVRQCKAAGLPVFVKQLGSNAQQIAYSTGTSDAEAHTWQRDGWTRIEQDDQTHWRKYLRLKDRGGADPAEWPLDLRVQEFPRELQVREYPAA